MADLDSFQETPSPSAVRHVRLFRNGANQALRIPKEFELPGKEALMRREGGLLIIEPVKPQFEKGSAAALLAVLNELSTHPSTQAPDDDWDVDAGLLPLDIIHLGNEQAP